MHDELKLKFKIFYWPVFFSIAGLALSGYWLIQLWLGPHVSGYVVAKEVLTQTVSATGKVELPAYIEISSKTGGKVVTLNVAEGQVIKEGDVLFTFEGKDDRVAIANVKAALAHAEARFRKINELTQSGSKQSLQRAKNSLENAQNQYARITVLSAKGFVSQDQSRDALHNLAIAQSQLATAQFQSKASRAKGSEYAIAELALNKARANEKSLREKSSNRMVKAEIDGILISHKLLPGKMILPGKTLMQISPLDKIQLIVQLKEKDFNGIKLGQPAKAKIEGHTDQHFNIEITNIASPVEISKGVFEVKLDFKHAPDYLQQNMLVSVEFEVMHHDNALSLSTDAVHNVADAQPWVMLVENGRAYRRVVRLGIRGNSKVEILEGLREGDLVLPAADSSIKEGKRIRLASAG